MCLTATYRFVSARQRRTPTRLSLQRFSFFIGTSRTSPLSQVITHRGSPLPADAWYSWILADGYLDCAWALAERAARIMRADQASATTCDAFHVWPSDLHPLRLYGS